MSKGILFLAHVSEADNTLPKVSYEVLGAALKLTKQLGAPLTIGLIGADVAAAAETIAAAGAERILAVAGPDLPARATRAMRRRRKHSAGQRKRN